MYAMNTSHPSISSSTHNTPCSPSTLSNNNNNNNNNNSSSSSTGDSNHRSPQPILNPSQQRQRPHPTPAERAGDERIEHVFLVYDERSSPCPSDSPVHPTSNKKKSLSSPMQTSLFSHSLSVSAGSVTHTPMSRPLALRQSTQQKQLTRTTNSNSSNSNNNSNSSSKRTFTQPR